MGARLTVIGLGPGDPALRTVGAQAALDRASRIVLRTRIHPGLDDLASDPRVTDCDDLYDLLATFDAVYDAVADRVVDETLSLAEGEVVFAVPGHPRFGERSVRLLAGKAAAAGVRFEIQPAVSALDAVAVSLDVDPLGEEVQLVDALALGAAVEREPFGGGSVVLDPSRPCLVGQVFSPAVAASVKLALARLYPEEHPVVVVRAAGVAGEERLTRCRLFELDRQPVDHLTSVWLPAQTPLEALRSAATLRRIVAQLRAPEGCPWDRAQTHESLRAAAIEEAYETVDAIDAGDAENLAEELGDLLLQVALHSQIAEEEGTFCLEDVYEAVSSKLLRRHPHVFGSVAADTPDEVVATWESVKAAERANTGTSRPHHPLDRLPRSMPALTRATTLLAPRKGTLSPKPTDAEEDAIGLALLAAVERAVAANVDPERALERALRRRGVDGAAAPDRRRDEEGRATA